MSTGPLIAAMATQNSPDLHMRVKNLETALRASMNLTQALLHKLEAKFGPDFLGEEFAALLTVGQETDQQISQINQLIKDGKQSTAARFVRDLTGVTWDQAHYVTQHWPGMPRDKKIGWLQMALWSKQVSQGVGADPRDDGDSK